MVTVYTTPTCGYCHATKLYLASKGIKFTEKDISNDREAMDWVARTVGQLATPVIAVGNEIILGFDRNRLDSALRHHKLV